VLFLYLSMILSLHNLFAYIVIMLYCCMVVDSLFFKDNICCSNVDIHVCFCFGGDLCC
jgi:hypothetical protein